MSAARRKNITLRLFIFFAALLAFVVLVLWFVQTLPASSISYSNAAPEVIATTSTAIATSTPPVFVVTHISAPADIRGIYMTSWTAGVQSYRTEISNLLSSGEINSVVIDVKDYSGRISFPVTDPQLQAIGSASNRIPDVEQYIGQLHAKGIYVIGRVAVFQDPFAITVRPQWAVTDDRTGKPWKDAGGAYWLDPDSRGAWDYTVAIAKQAYAVGFDEINFDYVRFPSDGDLADAVFSKPASTTRAEVITSFFSYLHDQLSPLGIPISADLFGQTTSADNDMGIGQLIGNAFPYFNYIDPMVYPSHFADGFIGYQNPADYPFQVVDYSMDHGVTRAIAASSSPDKLRPWLQAFDLGAIYTPAMVQDEMEATEVNGLNSWLFWNAGVQYNVPELVPPAVASSSMNSFVIASKKKTVATSSVEVASSTASRIASSTVDK